MKIKQGPNSKVYFTSDPHYSHKNIVLGATTWVNPPVAFNGWPSYEQKEIYCKQNGLRPFATLEDMNEALVTRFNETVGQDDVLFMLGDVAFGGTENIGIFMNRLICKNVYLVYGNHDHKIIRDQNLRGYFKRCEYYMEVNVDGQNICMFHYAARVWENSHRGSWFLYGHSHGSLPEMGNHKTMDVGVDTNEMYPYSFDELKRIMDKRSVIEVDHHHNKNL